MSYDTIQWEQSGGIGRITLNRPETLNAWTAEFGAELRQAVNEDAADPSVRAVLITGAGRGFSSGADLKAGFEPHPEDGMPNVAQTLHEVYHPIIVGIRGSRSRSWPPSTARPSASAVAGAGLRPDPGRRVGLLRPGVREHRSDAGRRLHAVRARGRGQGARLPDGDAGRAGGGQRALEWGLVNFVHPDDGLMDEAEELVEKLAAGPTRSYAGTKQALNRMLYPDMEGQLDLEAELQHALARSSDFMEGVGAFVEKGEGGFTGGGCRGIECGRLATRRLHTGPA